MDCLEQEAHKRYNNSIAEGDVLPPTSFKVTQLDPANNPTHKEPFLFWRIFASCRNAKVNPHHKNFNPSTKAGQAIFERKTKGLPADKRFTATKKYSQGICRLLQAKSLSLGAGVTRFPQEYYGAVNGNAHGNLLTEYCPLK